ncbi:MAG: RNA methyltransferase [Acidimicrobiales bacterium]|nr:RNA methyltransferase [Acidimicrobiales bacterium]
MADLPAPLSGRNPRITTLRRLLGRRSARLDARRVVLEGRTLLDEAVAASASGGPALVEVYVDADAPDVAEVLRLAERAGATPFVVQAGTVARVASTTTPQPVLAVATMPHHDLTAVAAAAPDAASVLVLVDVADPGNVGTLVRSAAAAGAHGVVTCGATADPWGPKAVRASAGAVLRTPVVPLAPADADPVAAVDAVVAAFGARTVGTVVAGGVPPDALDLATGRVALLVGNEAHGLPAEVLEVLDATTTVPMAAGTESLNAAMAGTVVLFEAARQRRAS